MDRTKSGGWDVSGLNQPLRGFREALNRDPMIPKDAKSLELLSV